MVLIVPEDVAQIPCEIIDKFRLCCCFSEAKLVQIN